MAEQVHTTDDANGAPNVVVSFRGTKLEVTLTHETTVEGIKTALIQQLCQQEQRQQENGSTAMLTSSDVKLLWKGKVLQDEATTASLLDRFTRTGNNKQSVYRIVATGVSPAERTDMDQSLQKGVHQSDTFVRDDLSEAGKQRAAERQRLGRRMLQQSRSKSSSAASSSSSSSFGFDSIQVLPNLPDQDKARSILTQLAHDPGILACMTQHQWKVGSLAELYPSGKVGESPVCVMGLNQNKGQQILLRLRTDDLQGFRKPLAIRKVLYHELAHNVHSEHDAQFFQLMRQIERECTALDWTRGAGLSSTTATSDVDRSYTGGVYRLGGGGGGGGDKENSGTVTTSSGAYSKRELAARAAILRMTAEEVEIEQNCACGRDDLFLPKSPSKNDVKDTDGMDTSD